MSINNNGDFPINPVSTSGSDLADRLNRLFTAINTTQSNPSRPTWVQAGGLWVQSGSGGQLVLNMFDGTTDHQVCSINAGVINVGKSTQLAPDYNPASSYVAGTYIFDPITAQYYRAKVDISTPEAYNPAKWQVDNSILNTLGSGGTTYAKLAGDTFTGPVVFKQGVHTEGRTTTHIEEANSGICDCSLSNDFKVTPQSPITLSFTNIIQGVRGMIYIHNTAGSSVKFGTGILKSSSAEGIVSKAGHYMLSYWHTGGSNIMITVSENLA